MKPHDEKLQLLYDAELPAAEADELRARLTKEDSEKLLALGEIDGLTGKMMLAQAEGLDLWARIEERLPGAAPRPRRRTFGYLGAASGLAMAATLLLLLFPHKVQQTNHCDVESLEVAGAVATVVSVPGEGGDETTVIWMDHQESDEWESL